MAKSNPSRIVLIGSGQTKKGHHPSFYSAVSNALDSLKKNHSVVYLPQSSGGAMGLPGRLLAVLSNAVTSLKVLFPCRNSVFLFMDAPCSFPLGTRIAIRLLRFFRILSPMYIICHAYPVGGDTRPVGNHRKYLSSFHSEGIFVHSNNLMDYLQGAVGVSSDKLHRFTWGTSHPREAEFSEKGRVRILFVGQYRSTKGLQWCWKEMQDIEVPITFRVVVSATSETAEKVRQEMLACHKNTAHQLEFIHSDYFTDDQISEFYKNIDFSIIPYFCEHSLVSGIVFLSAQNGCPVISSTHSESGFIPENNGFGYFFTPGDGPSMKSKILAYASSTTSQKHELRKRALMFAAQNEWNANLRKIFEVIEPND